MNMKKTKNTSTINSAASASSAQSTNSYMQYTQYRNKQAHGWAAEDANAMADRLSGKRVDQVGRNNSGNGADRISNGVQIQTKYCASAEESVNAAFQNCKYRYEGMKLEVPKDQYDEAVKLMADKIKSGQVPGVSDPAVAKDMVYKGSCTYEQAKNIAQAGNIDSITFDIKTQSVTCGLTCGLSFAVTFYKCVDSGMDGTEALKQASIQAAKSGGFALATGVVTQQLLRTTAGRALAASSTQVSRTVVDTVCQTQVGQQVVEKIASATLGKEVVGQAAKNVLTKGMRTNIVTGGVVLTAQTGIDVYKLCKGEISAGELCENAVCNTAGIGGGYAGASVGAAIGTAIFPGVGTAIGGFIGAIGGGVAGSSLVRGICSIFH